MPGRRTPPRHGQHQAEDDFNEPPPIGHAICDALRRAWDLVEAAEGRARSTHIAEAPPARH